MWSRWLMPVFLAAQERSNRQIAEAERHRDEVKGALEALREEIEARTARRATHRTARGPRMPSTNGNSRCKDATEAGERALADADRELERARAAARHQLREEMLERALQLARELAMQRVGPRSGRAFRRTLRRFVGACSAWLTRRLLAAMPLRSPRSRARRT